MTTTQALYVLEVAACRSMSRAAQRLYVSQSAISQQIQKLEQELGCALFTRTAAGPELLSGAFYDRIVEFCKQYGINCLGYEMKIPETDEPMMIAIWRNGHVDSGSVEHIRAVMDQ